MTKTSKNPTDVAILRRKKGKKTDNDTTEKDVDSSST